MHSFKLISKKDQSIVISTAEFISLHLSILGMITVRPGKMKYGGVPQMITVRHGSGNRPESPAMEPAILRGSAFSGEK